MRKGIIYISEIIMIFAWSECLLIDIEMIGAACVEVFKIPLLPTE